MIDAIRHKNSVLILLIALLLVPAASALAQNNNGHVPSLERGDPDASRKTDIDGNLVRATIFNNGMTGRTGNVPDEIAYEWPKNTGQEYIALTGLFVGGEVISETGDTLRIIAVPNWRNDPQGRSWTLEAVPGYQNPNSEEIAKSDREDSWPLCWPDKIKDLNDPGWCGSWNGFFGKNQFNADQEIYYKASDDLYSKFNYFPDSTDLTRRGLALLIDVRILEWSQVLVTDVVFILHEITNDGTENIAKASFALWLADLVGGDGDSGDDEPSFDQIQNIAWSKDRDGVGNEAFGDDPVGVAASTFLETPGNPTDGIDNDGDADDPLYATLLAEWPDNLVPLFVESDFKSKYKSPGDTLVLIDPSNFSRIIIEYPEGGGTVSSMGRDFVLPAGGLLLEESDSIFNLIDDDLDGLIDEKSSIHLTRLNKDGTTSPVRYINYLAFSPGDTLKRGLLVPGMNTPYTQENLAPMIDESRSDGVDNDRDWKAAIDDVGLDGKPESGDIGEGDGIPTSGANTKLPGEPNIDKTDVSESDQLGLTGATYIAAGSVPLSADSRLWGLAMTPGEFYDPNENLPTDTDLFVNSAYFPLLAGETERISMAIILGQDEDDALRNRAAALEAYETDYQFAKAPMTPTVRSVSGDGYVTLYWDIVAESSFDRFMADRGGNGFDFEGYRIYRATEAAFRDAYTVTDADGNLTYYKPIASFDLKDGIFGLHSEDINGIKFDMGDDSGLKHVFTDSGLTNGQKYFYAVTAFDFGGPVGEGIVPTETPIAISLQPDGSVELGKNVVEVIPGPKPAGYMPAEFSELKHTGGATGIVTMSIIDPAAIKDHTDYFITFVDTTLPGKTSTKPDTLSTKWFNLFSVAGADTDTILWEDTRYNKEDELPVVDGFQLYFDNVARVAFDTTRTNSFWVDDPESKMGFTLRVHSMGRVVGSPYPSDYMIEFGEVGIDTSIATTREELGLATLKTPVNFRVKNLTFDRYIKFAFMDAPDTLGAGKLSVTDEESDRIVFFDSTEAGEVISWHFLLFYREGKEQPKAGDAIMLRIKKPFLSFDRYDFTTFGTVLNETKETSDLSKVKVVPNPYIAAASWEPKNPFSSGRGPREIHFNHVPAKCTIRIFNVVGELVDVIEVNNSKENGIANWDLLTRDNLEASYGVYIYHIETESGESITGKFAIIK